MSYISLTMPPRAYEPPAARVSTTTKWCVAAWVAALGLHTLAARATYTAGVVTYGMTGMRPLPDLVHAAVPSTQAWRAVPELLHILPILLLAGCWLAAAAMSFPPVLLGHACADDNARMARSFRGFAASHAALLVLRAACFAFTLLPDPSQQCTRSPYLGSCHDLVFSGHAAIATLATLHLEAFVLRSWEVVTRAFFRLNLAATCILIITSRNHYTVDVVLAVALAALVHTAVLHHPWLSDVLRTNGKRAE